MDVYARCRNGETMWSLGQRGPWRSAGAVGVAASLLAAGALALWSPNPAAADTVVETAQGAQIISSGGQAQPARRGDVVPRGATVQTTGTGQATLLTAGRETWIGAASAVRVDDGARQEVTAGSIMVDARRAAALTLLTDVAEVSVARGALVRVERGPMLRVAQFAGSSAVVPHGRRARTAVAALYQVQVARGGLPGPVTALALTSDRWERAMVGDLVSEDADLTHLAAGLDGPGAAGQAVLAVLPASLQSIAPVPAGAPRSEQGLAWGLAAGAATGTAVEPTALAARYAQVRQLRGEGGSWAVVARLVGADTGGIDGLLERLLEPAGAPAGRLGQFALVGLVPLSGSTPPPVGSLPDREAARPGAGTGAGATGAASPPGAPAAPSPRPSTTASGTAQAVVDTVVALLPTPVPTPLPPLSAVVLPAGASASLP